ncbi:MAG: hypothetical protein ACO3RV_04295 [Luteolibacter sp.]
MKCPRCIQVIHRAAESCPHCGFSQADAVALFGQQRPRLRRFSDPVGVFNLATRDPIERAIDAFSRRFPQFFVAVHTHSLAAPAQLRPYGLWLLNHAQFEDLPAGLENSAGILWIIDPDTKTAGAVFGYQFESIIDEADTFECLARAHAYWLEGRYFDGLKRLLHHLEIILIKRGRRRR